MKNNHTHPTERKTTTKTPELHCSSEPVDSLAVFTWLWACQTLVHQEFFPSWIHEGELAGWALTLIAILSVAYPRSVCALSALSIASLVHNVERWPFIVNHILVEGLVNFVIIVGLFRYWAFRGETVAERRAELWKQVRPIAITSILVVYYFAFLAKLNHDFLEPELSCASSMYRHVRAVLPILPQGEIVNRTVIWFTLVLEAVLPVLLTLGSTRKLGIILGLGFHFVLGIIGHRTFSAFVFGMYGWFLIKDLPAGLNDILQRIDSRCGPHVVRRLITWVRATVLITCVSLIVIRIWSTERPTFEPLSDKVLKWAWCLWSVVIMLWYSYTLSRFPVAKLVDSARKPSLVLWLAPLLLTFNGLCPYIGLKTQTCFTMYSNLRTENGRCNHLFMPSIPVFGFQTDVVEILSTNQPELARFVHSDRLLTYFEFRRTVSGASGSFWVEFNRNGSHGRIDTTSGPIAPAPWWQQKLLYFRSYPKEGRVKCAH